MYSQVQIDMVKAALGGTVRAPSLTGEIELKVRPLFISRTTVR